MLKLQKKTQFLRKVDRVLCVFRDIASYARNLKVAPPVMAAQGKRGDVDGEPVFAPPRRSVGASLFSVTRPSLPAFLASNLKVFGVPQHNPVAA